MRVGVIGAGGPTGRRVTRDLIEHPSMGRVVAIDEAQVAPELLELIPDEATGVGLSPAAGDDLSLALREVDLAIGCVAPEHEVPAALAAIDAGVPYISSCWELEAFEALLTLDEAATKAGTYVLAGLGWTPGITNLLAAAAADQVDEVEEVRVYWSVSAADGGREVIVRALRSFAGVVPVFEEGAWRREPAGGEPEGVYFPEPVGWRPVRLVAGPEALTLPKHFSGVRKVMVKGGVSEATVGRAVRALAARVGSGPPARRERMIALARPLLPFTGMGTSAPAWSAARVDVLGRRGGAPVHVVYGVLDQYANLVSVPLVAAVLLAASQKITAKGVVAPEESIDPQTFLGTLAERGVRAARLER